MLPAVWCNDAAETVQFHADVVEQAPEFAAAVSIHGFRLSRFSNTALRQSLTSDWLTASVDCPIARSDSLL